MQTNLEGYSRKVFGKGQGLKTKTFGRLLDETLVLHHKSQVNSNYSDQQVKAVELVYCYNTYNRFL